MHVRYSKGVAGSLLKVLDFAFVMFIARSLHSPSFATVAVEDISGSQPAEVHNLGM